MTNQHTPMDDSVRPLRSADPATQATTEQTLRQRAEALFRKEEQVAIETLAPKDVELLLHELRVHHIELEMQNEELRQIQADLQDSQARYFDLYNFAPISYLTLSKKGFIQEANLTAAHVLMVDRITLIHQPLSQFIVVADQAIYYLHRKLLFETGEPQVYELCMLRHNHTFFWARIETTLVSNQERAEEVCHMVISDITARHQAEAALRELNATLEQRVVERTAALAASSIALEHTNAELSQALRLKDEFLAMMSHELRTPLNIIQTLVESLMHETYGPVGERQQKVLTTIMQSERHLHTILSTILDVARITAGKEALEYAPLDVNLLCHSVLESFGPVAKAKGVCISFSALLWPNEIPIDQRRLTQILVNLLDNAIKFTPAGGSVGLDVMVDSDERYLRLSVWDTGIGIAEADMERIFHPFTQLDAQLSRQYEGIGLGLTLVRRIVDLHGGTISIKSTPRQGSRFTISLPVGAQNGERRA